MNVLVLGGTRFIGPFVVRQLAASGHAVTVFHRGKSEPDLPDGVCHIHGDRVALAEFAPQLRAVRADAVVDMLALTADDARPVIRVLEGHVGRVVVVSSMDVYRAYDALRERDTELQRVPFAEDDALRGRLFPYRGAQPREVDDPQRWQDDYDKILVERAFMEAPHFATTVVRLPAVYGPGDDQHRLRNVARRIADNRPVMVLDTWTAQWRFTHGYVEDVAAAIALTVTNAAAAGRIYNVGEQDTPSQDEWIRRVGAASGWKGEVVVVSGDVLPEKMRPEGLNLRQHMVGDTGRIRRELGFAERAAWDDGVRRTIEWELENLPADVDLLEDEYAAEDDAVARSRSSS